MSYQTAANILVAVHRESTTGTAATATGASVVRLINSQGLELKRAQIQSEEKRADAVKPMGRLGGKSVDGTINAELTVGGATDIFLEAIMRSAWATATSIGFATMTTVAIGTNYLTAAGGDWVGTQGLRVGDVFKVSGTTVSADNNINVPIIALTSVTITVPSGTFATLTASATGTLTRLKRVVTAASPTRYSHTIEQNNTDIDLSELFVGCRLTGMTWSLKPGQNVQASYTFMGMDRTALATGTSPYFTSPTTTTGLSLVADDSSILKSGTAVSTFTGFDLRFDIAAKGEPVIGSFVTPDIFDNDLSVSGTITGLRSDFANLTLFDAETEFEIMILLQEPATAPKPCIGLYLPRVKIAGLSAPAGGGDGAKIETLTLMVGPKVAATGYDGSVATFSSSAA
jgi:hypothetical protein